MSLINVLISLSCSLNFFSASSNTSSLNWEKDEEFLEQNKPKSQSPKPFFFNPYLRCHSCELLEVAADTVGFLNNGVHAQLGDLVDERVFIPFSVFHHCAQKKIHFVNTFITTVQHKKPGAKLLPRSFLRLYSLMFTLISLTTCTALVSCSLSWWLSGVAPRSSVSSRGYRITRCTGLMRNEPRLM